MTAYVLNLADLGCTLCALRLGCTELNPLMQCVPLMVAYKVIIVGAACWWLSKRPERIARAGLNICAAAYGGLAIHHAAGLAIILT